jgi:hypothetical protein
VRVIKIYKLERLIVVLAKSHSSPGDIAETVVCNCRRKYGWENYVFDSNGCASIFRRLRNVMGEESVALLA